MVQRRVPASTWEGWHCHPAPEGCSFPKLLLLLADQGQRMVTSHVLSLTSQGRGQGLRWGRSSTVLSSCFLLLSRITAPLPLDFPILSPFLSAQHLFTGQAIPSNQPGLQARGSHLNQRAGRP